jgi:hypothetical protein
VWHWWPNRSERLSEAPWKGGCSLLSRFDPVYIPHDIENRRVATGIDEGRNSRLAALLPHLRRSRKRARPTSQGGDTGSNPVGTTQVRGLISCWRRCVARSVHGTVTDHTRKARNLARDPRCTLSVAMREFDLVTSRGRAPVSDPPSSRPWRSAGPRKVGRAGWTTRARLDRRVQRTLGGPTHVVRLPHHRAVGNRARDPQTRRRDPVALLIKRVTTRPAKRATSSS